jgi:hypothetical protein
MTIFGPKLIGLVAEDRSGFNRLLEDRPEGGEVRIDTALYRHPPVECLCCPARTLSVS